MKQNNITMNNNLFICGERQRIWAIGDVHGCYRQFMEIINSPYIGKNDIIILIGDIIDRGPDSVKMLEWAMKNVNNGGKYLMLRGNHEQNIIDDYNFFVEKYARKNQFRIKAGEVPLDYKEMSIYNLNCYYDFCEYMERAKVLQVGQAIKYIEWMKTLPLYMIVQMPDQKKFVLAHAWFNGKLAEDGSIRPVISDDEILWYRDIDSLDRILNEDYQPAENEMLIHGHTPIPVIEGFKTKLAEPLIREHSVNIDGGCFIGRQKGGRLIALCLNDLWSFYSS